MIFKLMAEEQENQLNRFNQMLDLFSMLVKVKEQ